jgi:L-lysine 2,3-aminomutase
MKWNTECMLLSPHQNTGQNHDTEIANRFFENVAQFRYFGTTVTNQSLIKEEIKRTLNRVMLATIQSRSICLLVCCLKTSKLDQTKL